MSEPAGPDVLRLLEGATPEVPPPPLAPDDEVAVTVWRRGTVAAVLFIWHDPDDDEEPYSQDVEIFEKIDGEWRSLGRGGSDWPVAFGERPPLGRPALTGYSSGTPDPNGDYLWIASGIAPPGVQRVRLQVEGFDDVVDVEPITGAFLVAVPTPEGPPVDAVVAIGEE